MAQQAIIKRWMLILEKLENASYPKFTELHEHLKNHEVDVRRRTVERDLEALRDRMGLIIHYDQHQKGYYIDHHTSGNPESLFRLMEIARTAELLTGSLESDKEALRFIHFENTGSFKGIQFLSDILLAFRNNHKLYFRHAPFHKSEPLEYVLIPELLKEYQNRWYVYGTVEGNMKKRIFGLDRIEELTVLPDKFNPEQSKTGEDAATMFDRIIGLSFPGEEPEEIILSFTPKQGNYIKTLPMHHSQEIWVDNDEELRIALYVIPNFELTQQILMHGEAVKVIEPEWLKKEVLNRLKKAVQQYNI